jgi:tetratricopeptide (TPR) repeat protein
MKLFRNLTSLRLHFQAFALFSILVSLSSFAKSTAIKKDDSKKNFDYLGFTGQFTAKKNLNETIDRLQKMEQLRSSAQSSLESLLKKGSNTELELRFAELIVQRGKDLEQFSFEVDFAGDSKKAKELLVNSHVLMKKGLGLHSNLLSKVSNHPMAPKVFLGMARTEYSLGRKNAALENAQKGLNTLGKSQNKNNLGDTHLQLLVIQGDSAFDLSKANVAKVAYKSALEICEKGSMDHAYLLYKTAWVEYNLKDSEKALEDLDELFKVSGDKYSLRQEAVQDFALFIADLPRHYIKDKRGDWSGLDSYLRNQSDESTAEMALKRLGSILSSNGRRNDAIELQEFLISKNPSHIKNYERALSVVEWSHHLADKSKLTDRYFWLLDYFGPRSAWYSNQSANPQVQRDAFEKIESSVRKYANDLHQQSGQEKNETIKKKLQDIVAKLYDAHIQNFNRETDIPRAETGRVHYYRAEIHRANKEWNEAGWRYDNYLRVLTLVPQEQVGKVDSQLKSDAIWGSVFVWAKAVEKDAKNAAQLMAAADRFLEFNPKDSKAPQVLLDAAFIEQKTGQTAVALKRLEKLVANYPKTKQAQLAVNTTLDILNKESDWINLAQYARKFTDSLSTWALPQEKSKIALELNKILSQTEAKACEALAQLPDRKLEAALCFERFASGFEKDPQAPKALLLSAEIFDQIKDPTAAVSALEKLVKKYSETEYATKGFSRLAGVYEKAFEFEKATQIYDSLLTKNTQLKDREKILARHLDLLDRLGETEKYNRWINHKLTPVSLKTELSQRAAADELVLLKIEEARLGWRDGKLASAQARQVQAKLEGELAKGRISIEREMELRRIRGLELKYQNKLDKADVEWLAGLKIFWKLKERTPQNWESAARIRLEQAAIWEVAFRNTSIMKNPAKKAELFKKLENWYAEVIEMKAPVAALAALWKSAEVNVAFADDVRSSPVPPELLAPGMESQKQTYEKLVLEKTEPLKKKALTIIEKIALKAREWKVISPVVLSSLRMTSQLRSGVELPGNLVRVDEGDVLKFPWIELPRWMDISPEQMSWKEWSLSQKTLLAALKQENGRSGARRAAYVLFARALDDSEYDLKKWVNTFSDKAGIQLRIQAYLKKNDLARAVLFLEQYESFFGQDAFAEFQWGQLEWKRGNYSLAYSRWVRPVYADSLKNFRNQYWLEGWGFLLDEMIEGWPTKSRRQEIFSKLNPLVRNLNDKLLLAKLCVDGAAECGGDLQKSDDLVKVLAMVDDGIRFQNYETSDGLSTWTVRQKVLGEFVSRQTMQAQKTEDLQVVRKALSAYYELIALTENSNKVRENFWSLTRKVDLKQESIEQAARNKIYAAQEKSSKEEVTQ